MSPTQVFPGPRPGHPTRRRPRKRGERIERDLADIAAVRKADHGLGAIGRSPTRPPPRPAQAQAQAVERTWTAELHAARRTLLVLVGRQSVDPLAAACRSPPKTCRLAGLAPGPACPASFFAAAPTYAKPNSQADLGHRAAKAQRIGPVPQVHPDQPGVGITDLKNIGITGFNQVGGVPSIGLGLDHVGDF